MKKEVKFLPFIIALIICFCLCVFCGCTDGETQSGQTDLGQSGEDNTVIEKIYFTVNGNKIAVALENNSAAAALVTLLKEGDVTYTADDYGGFEKVGSLGQTLPHGDTQITTRAGDVMLYSGDQIVIFYGSNSWAYTKLGTIAGYSTEELKTLLSAGEGEIKITISLN